ncbi:hypothetical protein MTR_7g080435 [Medicago truncatula]|uniref:Uncharacterized protein n=1 Tax=Medicago truncatula TaxID=3880 RepID=A0A072U113_MEDTR|nr:hypothetical protein MTR_7g080435 [Medicago truncatula]
MAFSSLSTTYGLNNLCELFVCLICIRGKLRYNSLDAFHIDFCCPYGANWEISKKQYQSNEVLNQTFVRTHYALVFMYKHSCAGILEALADVF